MVNTIICFKITKGDILYWECKKEKSDENPSIASLLKCLRRDSRDLICCYGYFEYFILLFTLYIILFHVFYMLYYTSLYYIIILYYFYILTIIYLILTISN